MARPGLSFQASSPREGFGKAWEISELTIGAGAGAGRSRAASAAVWHREAVTSCDCHDADLRQGCPDPAQGLPKSAPTLRPFLKAMTR